MRPFSSHTLFLRGRYLPFVAHNLRCELLAWRFAAEAFSSYHLIPLHGKFEEMRARTSQTRYVFLNFWSLEFGLAVYLSPVSPTQFLGGSGGMDLSTGKSPGPLGAGKFGYVASEGKS